MEKNLATNYNPKDFEDRLYDFWQTNDYFKAEVNEDKEPFTIMMPPPNVTGRLHMGHALNNTIQDILIRWKRLEGYEALWQPGTDHASISTEVMVVDKIRSEGKTKEDLGRDGFLEEAWDWTHQYGGEIKDQLKKLGVSCDWSRDKFTLDEDMSEAVQEVFIKLYEKDLIYRGNRIINWCPSCETAISDTEVEHEDKKGKIWHIKYPIKDSDDFIEIATTRPETVLGDLAVAVNPKDERYEDLVGKMVILPLMDREIPIIADDYVEMDFGTGAVKITPSHDANDFEVGKRANLGQCIIMDGKGYINDNGGDYEGLERFEARKKIVEDLEKLGYLVGIKDHDNSIGHCERCDTVIEPLISKQWFVKMAPLAEPAIEAYKNGEVKFIPERLGKIYLNWMENIQDWCISRQLWWGHRLPVYYCEDCEEIIVSREEVKSCSKCDSSNVKQDEDTLDTWFSSALWPFSTLGWPKDTKDLDYFFPTDVLVTGYDIIFFWVARMIFSSIEQMGELPFKDVFLTGLVLDENGIKMSKSLGNGIDPLDVIDLYGADAMRFTLVTGNTPGNDMRFSTERVESNRNFANKLWNATRFVLMNLDRETAVEEIDLTSLEEEDKWILSRLNNTVKEVTKNLDRFELGMAADRIYNFIWEDYCDWYIEMVKSRLYGDDSDSKKLAGQVLLYVLKDINRLLHPFMPFITEEIWQHLPVDEKALIASTWPQYREELDFKESESNIEYIKEAIKKIRNARAEMNIVPSRSSDIYFLTKDEAIEELLLASKRYFVDLVNAEAIETIEDPTSLEDNMAVVLDKAEAFLPLSDLIDYKKELDRLEKEKSRLEGEIKRVNGKLSNENFTSRAPEHVVEEEREKKSKYENMMETVLESIENIKDKI